MACVRCIDHACVITRGANGIPLFLSLLRIDRRRVVALRSPRALLVLRTFRGVLRLGLVFRCLRVVAAVCRGEQAVNNSYARPALLI